jgi:hypothetical protein
MNELTPDVDAEILVAKRRRLELLRAKKHAIKEYGLPFYRPSPKQDAFHRAGGHVKRRMLRAGNRFGKSTCGCAEDCAFALGERPWYPTSDPARYAGIPKHPVKILIITTDWDKVDEIWTSERGDAPGKIWTMLPRANVVSKRRNHSGAIDTIEVKSKLYSGNSLIRFDTVKSFKSNPQGSESSDWDVVHVDEPCPEAMFKASARGLVDRHGVAYFTLTPLAEFWINDFFFPQDTGGQPRDGVWSETASIHDNPFLSPQAIKEYLDTLSTEERECREKGIPLHLAGLVYKDFSWDTHVLKELPKGWKSWMEPPESWPIYLHIDPHPRTPHAVLFCTVDPLGNRYYFHDIFRHCGIAELVQEINLVLRNRWLREVRIDPIAFIDMPMPNTKRGTTTTCMAWDFEDNGLYVEPATKALAHGILRVQENLKQRPPGMFFTPSCRRTLWEIQRYAWDEGKDSPVDADDHMMENLYRQELAEPKWAERTLTCPEIKDMNIVSPNFRADEPVSLAL